MLWLTGAAVSLLTMGLGAAWLHRLGSRAIVAGANWTNMQAQLCAQAGLRRPVRILVTRHPALLVTWGVVNPVILLPMTSFLVLSDRRRCRMSVNHPVVLARTERDLTV